jgi:glycosyltransferase involved in cell wall biosynthesis
VTRTSHDDLCTSASWSAGAPPDVSVHIATYRRSGFLPALVAALEAQTLPAGRFEVVIVDNGSDDDTWSVLTEQVARSSLRLAALRIAQNRGPAAARNAAVAVSHGALLAFTDDDCLPSPRWLAALLVAADGADLVQGRTEPDPDPAGMQSGPWARTIRIVEPTALFETCNIAYRRSAFERVGGFDEGHAVSARPGGRAFGEDVLLGSSVVASGGVRRFAPDALVHHRYLPASFADHLRSMRELAGFPALARESAALSDALWRRVFLTRRTAAFDLAAVGSVLAARHRRLRFLALVLPWVLLTWPTTRAHGGRPAIVRLAQLGVADAVGAAALIEGSLRHRRLVL